MYAVWPFIDGFAAFLAVMVVHQIIETAGWSGRGAYTLDVFPREERVQSQAFMRAALNIGFTLGALIGGIALAFNNDDIVRAVPWLTGAILRGQRPLHHPVARRRARPGACGARPAGQRGSPAQQGIPAPQCVRRGARHQPGPAQHRDPAVAGRGDRCAAGAAGLAVRHQHRDGGLPPGRCRARRRLRRPVTARVADQRGLLRGLVRDRAGHPRHHRLGHDLPGLARPCDRHRRRAVPVRRPLGLHVRAVGSATARRVPRRRPSSAARPAASGRRRCSRSSP